MTLQDLGFYPELETYRLEKDLSSFQLARVSSEHKDRYTVLTDDREYSAELLGNLRYSAASRSDLPIVGDWVAISEFDEEKAMIHHVYPRRTLIERLAVGKQGEKQAIASNIDVAFLVQAVDRDFNVNRLERYLTICLSAGVTPVILLTKVDLIDQKQRQEIVARIKNRIESIQILELSNLNEEGLDEVRALMQRGKTYTLLGSSGVGKSTLVNHLIGDHVMDTIEINESIQRGRHRTTHRALMVVPTGGIIIDNPGMRSVGVADSASGIEQTFDLIVALSSQCKYSDCSHSDEPGCAIQSAIEEGNLQMEELENYHKMLKEEAHYSASVAEKREQGRAFGKMYKQIMKDKKKRKY